MLEENASLGPIECWWKLARKLQNDAQVSASTF
jgi:hypothetical protein